MAVEGGAQSRSSYSCRATRIPGTDPVAFQWEICNETEGYAVLKVAPKQWAPDAVAYVPAEATLSLVLSRSGWYDCFADVSLNRLANPDVPIFVTYLRGDGMRLPVWQVQSRRDAGAYVTHLQLDPEPGGDMRLKELQASVVQKLTETGNPAGLTMVTDSGSYYVDGTLGVPTLPVAESGTIEVRMNPYSSDSGLQVYRSFSDPTHQYARVRSGGSWADWTAI